MVEIEWLASPRFKKSLFLLFEDTYLLVVFSDESINSSWFCFRIITNNLYGSQTIIYDWTIPLHKCMEFKIDFRFCASSNSCQLRNTG